MKYGPLFRCFMKAYHIDNFSNNKLSNLKYNELRTIAKCLYRDNYIRINYTHMTRMELVRCCFDAMNDLIDNIEKAD